MASNKYHSEWCSQMRLARTHERVYASKRNEAYPRHDKQAGKSRIHCRAVDDMLTAIRRHMDQAAVAHGELRQKAVALSEAEALVTDDPLSPVQVVQAPVPGLVHLVGQVFPARTIPVKGHSQGAPDPVDCQLSLTDPLDLIAAVAPEGLSVQEITRSVINANILRPFSRT